MNPIASLKGQTSQIHAAMKYGELIANKESAAGFTCGYCSAVTRGGWRWILDAHKTTANAISSNLTNSSAPSGARSDAAAWLTV